MSEQPDTTATGPAPAVPPQHAQLAVLDDGIEIDRRDIDPGIIRNPTPGFVQIGDTHYATTKASLDLALDHTLGELANLLAIRHYLLDENARTSRQTDRLKQTLLEELPVDREAAQPVVDYIVDNFQPRTPAASPAITSIYEPDTASTAAPTATSTQPSTGNDTLGEPSAETSTTTSSPAPTENPS